MRPPIIHSLSMLGAPPSSGGKCLHIGCDVCARCSADPMVCERGTSVRLPVVCLGAVAWPVHRGEVVGPCGLLGFEVDRVMVDWTTRDVHVGLLVG